VLPRSFKESVHDESITLTANGRGVHRREQQTDNGVAALPSWRANSAARSQSLVPQNVKWVKRVALVTIEWKKSPET